MRLAAAVLVTFALLASGCDGSESKSPGTQSAAVYFLRDGKLSPVRRMVETSPTPGRTALASLFEGPTSAERADGLGTAIPQGTTLDGVTLTDGVATVGLRGDLPASRDQRLLETAQIVATLTRFPTVRAVRLAGGSTWTRHEIEQQTPQILVESPLPGDRVTSPIRVRGTANVFEATVSFEVRDDHGKVVRRSFTTATSGTGTRGTFDTELAVQGAAGPVTIVAFEASAEDGSPLHVTTVPVTVVP
jgi:hypothetical protein